MFEATGACGISILKSRFTALAAAATLLALVLSACGGGGGNTASGGGTSGTTPPAAQTVTVSGVAGKGLLLNAIVNFYTVTGGTASTTTVATVRTSATTGAFTSPVTSSGPVLVTLTVDSSTQMLDELSGASGAAPTGLVLHAAIDSLTNLQPIAVTPLTEMAYDIASAASGGLTVANIDAANTAVGAAFLGGASPLATQPIDVANYATAPAAQQELSKLLVALAVAANQGTAAGAAGIACTPTAYPTYSARLVCMIGGLGSLLTVNSSGQGALTASANYVVDAYDQIDSGAVTVEGGKAPSTLGLNVATQAETALATAVTTQAPLPGYNSSAAPLPNTKAFFADLRTNALDQATAEQTFDLAPVAAAVSADFKANAEPALYGTVLATSAMKVASDLITQGAAAPSVGSTANMINPAGVALGANGGLYVADDGEDVIVQVNSSGVISPFAGSPNLTGTANGQGVAARFSSPSDVTTDNAGNVYITDTGNNSIRMITPAGVVATIAGGSNVSGSNHLGFKDGPGATALFSQPGGIVFDPTSNSLYVADTGNSAIRMIELQDSQYTVTTIAGGGGNYGTSVNGIFGFKDAAGATALLFYPEGVSVDKSGNIYVADTINSAIRKIAASNYAVTTIAGGGTGTYGAAGFADASGTAARFNLPFGLAVDGSGNVFVADTFNDVIREINSSGNVTTIAGTAPSGSVIAPVVVAGSADGALGVASFNLPARMVIDSSGNFYVADAANNAVRKLTSGGIVTTFAKSVAAYRSEKSSVVCGYDPVVLNTATNAAQCRYGGYGNPMLMTVTQTAVGTFTVQTQPLTGTQADSANSVLGGLTPSSTLQPLDASFTLVAGTDSSQTATVSGPLYVTATGGQVTDDITIAVSNLNLFTASGTASLSGTISGGAGGISLTTATIGSDSTITLQNGIGIEIAGGIAGQLTAAAPLSLQATLDISNVTTSAYVYGAKFTIGPPTADKSGKLEVPDTAMLAGSIAQIGAGGVQTPLFSGSVAVSTMGVGSYDATQPISSSNFAVLQVQVDGTFTLPGGRLLSVMATVNGSQLVPTPAAPDSLTATYTYTTSSGTRMVNATAKYDSVNGYSGTLTNNGGVKVTVTDPIGGPLSGIATDNGTQTATLTGAGTAGPTINYSDGTTESLF